MNLCVESGSASFSYLADSLEKLVDRLEGNGYEPLVRKAAENFCSVFGATVEELFAPKSVDDDEYDDLDLEREIGRRRLINLERLGYIWSPESHRPLGRLIGLKGELFYTDDRNGLLFISILEYAGKSATNSDTLGPDGMCRVRIGYVGDPDEKMSLNTFGEDVTKAFDSLGIDIQWVKDDLHNKEFQNLFATEGDSKYLHPPDIIEKELRAAKILESPTVRDLALLVRQAGVILAKELLKQKVDAAPDIIKHVDSLLQAELVHQEYVVICSKTGSHVNRVDSRETIDRMSQMGVLCSCGQPISAEPIEGLLAADPLLQKMIDRNFWMVATVMRQLKALDVSAERILIDSSDSGDQLEFMVDVDGTLVMFEFRDGEFGVSQAINIGGRIALHRPKLMFIVTTKGISPEVREHFKRTKPEAQIVYVPNTTQLESTLRTVIEGLRMMRARSWMAYFQTLLNFPLASLVLPKLIQSQGFEIPHVVTSVQIKTEEPSPPLPPPPAPPPAAAPAPLKLEVPILQRKIEQIQANLPRIEDPLSVQIQSAAAAPLQSAPVEAPVAPQMPVDETPTPQMRVEEPPTLQMHLEEQPTVTTQAEEPPTLQMHLQEAPVVPAMAQDVPSMQIGQEEEEIPALQIKAEEIPSMQITPEELSSVQLAPEEETVPSPSGAAR